MTTPDLRAAAERVRRLDAGETNEAVYCANPAEAASMLLEDMSKLANAHIDYLASLPADGDVEIDEAWLVSVGGKWIDNKAIELESSECDLWWSKETPDMVRIYAKGAAADEYIETKQRTRSDLRGLCERLGVPLKEGDA